MIDTVLVPRSNTFLLFIGFVVLMLIKPQRCEGEVTTNMKGKSGQVRLQCYVLIGLNTKPQMKRFFAHIFLTQHDH